MKELLAKLKKLEGGEALATEFEAALKTSAEDADGTRSELATLRAQAKTLTAENKKLAGDVAAAAKDPEGRIDALTKERDGLVTERDAEKAARAHDKLLGEIANDFANDKSEHYIADPSRRKHAVKTLAAEFLTEDVHLDDRGRLVGLTKAVKPMKEEYGHLFEATTPEAKVKGDGGGRSGGIIPIRSVPGDDAPQEAKIAAYKAKAIALLPKIPNEAKR